MNVLFEILSRRLERIGAEGPAFGHPVPAERKVPLVPFLREPAVICEIKKRSPSRGDINAGLDPVAQASHYRDAGIPTVSVLTEEDRFGGSLSDLMAVKTAFPGLSVLRKDFLATPEDIEISYRAGADAVLLIAGMLELPKLRELYMLARGLGMSVLFEVHSQEDVDKARELRPRFTGINCRDLVSFRIDPALPLGVRPLIDWHTRVVFESGIFQPEDAAWTAAAGFHGVLVGEGAVRDPALAPQLAKTYRPSPRPSFWARLLARRRGRRPLVKVCGLTRREDVQLADSLGADAVGFILTESPRRVETSFIRSLPGTSALKIGVVRLGAGEDIPSGIAELLREGSLDALQFHGLETAADLRRWMDYGFKALSPANSAEVEAWDGAWPPRQLLDAFVPGQSGGTGKRVDEALLEALGSRPLWLAGGLNPDNIGDIVRRWKPELVDASSGLESSPGTKDHDKMRRYFEEIIHAVE